MSLRRAFFVASLGALAVAAGLAPEAKAQQPINQINTYFHYPYGYYPHNYWPNQVRWPDPRQQFQQPPAYQAAPRLQDPFFRYEILENRRYHRGFHFFLDQF